MFPTVFLEYFQKSPNASETECWQTEAASRMTTKQFIGRIAFAQRKTPLLALIPTATPMLFAGGVVCGG